MQIVLERVLWRRIARWPRGSCTAFAVPVIGPTLSARPAPVQEAMFRREPLRREQATAGARDPSQRSGRDRHRRTGARRPTPRGSGWCADELQDSSREREGERGQMSGKFRVYAGCAACLAGMIILGSAAMAQETMIAPDGRCVVSYGDRQPTVDEMKHALELGENCLRTRGLRRESSAAEPGTSCPRGSSLALNISFEFNSAILTEDARRQLEAGRRGHG